MAKLKIIHNPDTDNYTNEDVIYNLISYILGLTEGKTRCEFKGGLGLDISSLEIIVKSMEYIQMHSRKYNGFKMIHFVVSFSDFEQRYLKREDYIKIGYEIATYFKYEYQIVFALHKDTDHYHFHYALNPVNCRTGKKYHLKIHDIDYLIGHINCVVGPYFPTYRFNNMLPDLGFQEPFNL